jgi:hypothetical protein
VLTTPNQLPQTIPMAHPDDGDGDSVLPASDAVMLGGWTSGAGASLIAFDPDATQPGGQIVFYAFNYSVMEETARASLLQNSVSWLLLPASAEGGVRGVVTQPGGAPLAAHVKVLRAGTSEAVFEKTAGADGSFTARGLAAGDYVVEVQVSGFVSATRPITIAHGQLTVNFTLTAASAR